MGLAYSHFHSLHTVPTYLPLLMTDFEANKVGELFSGMSLDSFAVARLRFATICMESESQIRIVIAMDERCKGCDDSGKGDLVGRG